MSLAPNTASAMIRRADVRDLDLVTDILVASFLDSEFGPWLMPDRTTRAKVYLGYFQMLAEHALTSGWVDLAEDGDGVAVWYLHGPDLAWAPPLPDYDRRLAEIVGTALPRFRALDTATHQRHPQGYSHHYLAYLAVLPQQQNRGSGSRLLSHHHRQTDAHRVRSYLEATSEHNQRLYDRHGYTALAPYRPGRDSPLLYPMERDPRMRRSGKRSHSPLDDDCH